MRYRPIQAASRERVPFTLWSPSRARTVLAAVAASAAALVPTVMIASPAQAASSYISISPTTATVAEGNTASFTVTSLGSSANGAGGTYTTSVTGGTASGSDYGSISGGSITWTQGATATVTLPILADQVLDSGETVTIRVVNASDATDFVDATITIADVGFTLTAPPVTETVTTPAVGNTPAVQKTARVTATLSAAAAYAVTIPLTVGQNGDTAVNGSGVSNAAYRDYDAPGGSPSISIPAGQTSGYFDITLFDDALDEEDTQYITVVAPTTNRVGASPTGTAGSGGTVRVNITDDDATPTVQIGGAGAVTEGNVLGFPLTLSAPSERTASVSVSTTNGVNSGDNYGATAPGDYTALNGQTVSIPPYATSASALVTTLTDSLVEASPEKLTATISSPANATLGAMTTAEGGINDANAAPTVDVSTSATTLAQTSFTNEGATGESERALTLTLSGTSTIPVRIDYTVGGGRATLGTDYKAANGSVTIPAGSLTATIPVTIVGDTIHEPGGETFNLTMSSPNSSVNFAGSTTRAFTIADDDTTAPSYSVADASVTEGNTGTTMARIPLTLSGATNADVVFNVATTAGTNAVTGAVETGVNAGVTSGADDYDNPSVGTVTVPAGSTTATIEIPVKGDTVYEKDQTFTVSATPVGGSQVTGTSAVNATVTILNDDAAPKMTFNESSGTEGTTIRALGTIVGASEYAYSVGIAWAGQGAAPSAASADDYSASNSISSPISVTRGQTGALGSPIADLFINQDTIDEPIEQLAVTATEVTGTLTGFATSTGVYKFNDDPGDLPPAASIRDETIEENEGSVDVHVDLAFAGDTTSTTQTVTIPYSTENGTAKAGEDYTYTKGTLSFEPGVTTKTINVPIIDDKTKEGAETFSVKLGTPGPSGASITKGTGEVTILANDSGSTPSEPEEPEEPQEPTEPGAPSIDAPAKVVGAVAVTVSGKADANTTVELWGAPMGDDTDLKWIANVESDDDGYYEFKRWIGQGYRFVTQSQEINSEEVTVQVQQNPVFVASSPSRGMLGLAVQGNPRGVGQAVIVQRWIGGKWVNTTWRGVTGSTNQWRTTAKVASGTTVIVRAFIAGYTPDGLLPGYSAAKKVTIK